MNGQDQFELKDAQPLHDRVLVDPWDKTDTKTASGLIIPKSVNEEKAAIGEVVCLGTGLSDREFTVEKGMVVVYGKFAGLEVQIGNKDYLVMRESDILLKFNKKEASAATV